jgi:hypothetical protein
MLFDPDLLLKLLDRKIFGPSFLELERWFLVVDGVFLGDVGNALLKLLAREIFGLPFLELELLLNIADRDFFGDDGSRKVDWGFLGDDGLRKVVGVLLGDPGGRKLGDAEVGVFSGDADLVGIFGVCADASADSVVFSESLSFGDGF